MVTTHLPIRGRKNVTVDAGKRHDRHVMNSGVLNLWWWVVPVFIIFYTYSFSEELHRGIIRRPLDVTCTGGCGNLFLEPDSGGQIIYLTDPLSRYLSGGDVGKHVEVTGFRADCNNCTPLFVTKELTYLPPTDVQSPLENIPKQFSIRQNFPNPFNPATMIEYSLPGEGFVDLTIYDMVGQHLRTLLSNKQQKGTYRVKWNAEEFPSGMYFVRVLFYGENGTRQARSMPMILLR